MTIDQLNHGNLVLAQLSEAKNELYRAERLTHLCSEWSASIKLLSKEDAKGVKELITRTLQRKITQLEVQLHTI